MSFDIALSGIQAINEQLTTVSNNIANAATYGFKSSRANFSSVYAGTKANGVEIGSITQSIAQNGSAVTTGRALDAAIDGRGFFVSRDLQGGLTYSRVGIFSADVQGYLIDSNGKRVQGYGPTTAGSALGAMGDIQVPTGQIPAVATKGIDYVGNMSSDWKTPTVAFNKDNTASYNMVKQSLVYDSLGAQHTVSQYFVKNGSNSVQVYYSFDGAATVAGTAPLTFGTDGKLTGGGTATVTYTTAQAPGATAGSVAFDYTGSTLYAGDATTTTNRSDGYASGAFIGVELSSDGSLVAKYSNDQSQVVGTLAIATFPNEGALTATSDTSWTANANSGDPLYNTPGVGLSGKLTTGTLEGSNVDITSELVGLMTSQRNYQANSKVLTTENQMMQALMQAL
ncbi:flagellar hook-basal body complex protein [Massilia sp. YIM B02763]|uniref:flagellar hook protein FlgE n=1 Tax=Massilia sp. YIM B02763 TaxID=3050130 RepID=UPI0025B6AA41|nr:flagellar hook-basal body complex protein [Massilia sp. YIM B02763]MDN4052982.1 flagellar hook-basal body complex protein [Massilia sp. YIM B02763]